MSALPTVSDATIAVLPDAAAIDAAASSFDRIGSALSDAMDSVEATWGRLRAPGVYETPESAQVHEAMRGPRAATDVIAEDGRRVREALRRYAEALALLSTRRAALVLDIRSANDAAAEAAKIPGGDLSECRAMAASLDSRIRGFNADVVAADSDCAAALRTFARYTSQQLGDAAAALNDNAGVGGALGVAGALMSNYDDLKDALVAELQVRGLAESTGRHVAAQSVVGVSGESARGRVAPGAAPTADARPSHLAGASDLRGASKAMRYGGKALGAVGTVATVGGAYLESYNENSVAHPEWTENHKNLKATEHAVVTGGVSAAGGIAGGMVGAQIGASIGSVVPGAGTVIGGLIGGLIGGIIGSGIGEKMGEGAEHLMDELFHW